MGCGDEKLSKYLTQTFTAHCNAMICQQVTLSGDAEWPKVADAVIEAVKRFADTKVHTFPPDADVPLDGVVHGLWCICSHDTGHMWEAISPQPVLTWFMRLQKEL